MCPKQTIFFSFLVFFMYLTVEALANELTNGILKVIPNIVSTCTITFVSMKGLTSGQSSNFFISLPKIQLGISTVYQNSTLRSRYHYFRHSKSCGISIYDVAGTNLLSENHLGQEFVRKSPGGIFHSYHIIFNAKLQQTVQWSDLVRQMHQVLFIAPSRNKDASSAILYTTNVWFNSTILLGNFWDGKLRIGNRKLFYDKWKDLGGSVLQMATTPDVTVPEMHAYHKTRVVTRYIVTAAFEYLRYINATPAALAVNPGVYGSKGKDGRWNGMVGALLNGSAQLSTVMGFAHERTEVITWTRSFYYDKAIFITGLPREFSLSGSLEFLARPLGASIWAGIILSFLAIYVVLLLNKYFSRKRENKSSNSKYFSILLLNMLMRPVLDQTADTPNLMRRTSDRLSRSLFALWLLSLIVLGNLYRCRVISILLSPDLFVPPKTFEELVDSPYEIGVVLYNESLLGEYFKAMHNRIGTEVRSRVKGYPFLKPDCYTEAITKNYHSCMGVGNLLEISSNLHVGRNFYRISKDSLFFILAGFAAPNKFPHLTRPLNRIIGRHEAQGLLEFYLAEEKRVKGVMGRKLKKAKGIPAVDPDDGKADKNPILHLVNICYIGLGGAAGLFLIEWFVFKWKAYRGNAKRVPELDVNVNVTEMEVEGEGLKVLVNRL